MMQSGATVTPSRIVAFTPTKQLSPSVTFPEIDAFGPMKQWSPTLESCAMSAPLHMITSSADYGIPGDGSERVFALCRASGAETYLSGPRARAYRDEAAFSAAGVEIAYMDYSGYPEYPQVHPPFDHYVSVLDLLFNVGPDAPRYLKSLVDATAATA